MIILWKHREMWEVISLLGVEFFGYVGNHIFPKPLSGEEEKSLLKKASEGDKEARNSLIEHNLRLVAHVCKKYENANIDKDDLISIGTIGLIKAIDSFSLERKVRLATYAARCIENEILMVLRAGKNQKKDISLYEPLGQDKEGNEVSLIDVLQSDKNSMDEELELQYAKAELLKNLEILDLRERKIIALRYGLGQGEKHTQKQVAEIMGISRSYVSRIEKKALESLRVATEQRN